MKPLDDCFRVLEVAPDAGPARITAAFRRLAKRYHPDVNPRPDAPRRFVEIAQAYERVRDELRWRPEAPPAGHCPRCGRRARLLDGLDGGPGCVDCLLGRTRRSRLLPLPTEVLVKHVCVVLLYGVSAGYLIACTLTGSLPYALSSALAATTGLLVLAREVLALAAPGSIRRADRPAKRGRAVRPGH